MTATKLYYILRLMKQDMFQNFLGVQHEMLIYPPVHCAVEPKSIFEELLNH